MQKFNYQKSNKATGKIYIGLDHGYGNIKTAHRVFQTGIECYDEEPIVSTNYVKYHWSVGLLQVGLYILTPYLVSSITALGILSMETRGKNSSLFGMSAILLSISYGVIGSIPRALFVTTLWIWAVAFLVSGLLFVIQIKKLLSKMEKGEVLCTN